MYSPIFGRLFAVVIIAFLLPPLVPQAEAAAAKDRKNDKDKTQWELIEALSSAGQIRGFNGTWITDDEFYYTASDRSIRKFNAITETNTELLNSNFLDSYSGSTFTLSPDNTKILVRYEVEEVFRHSFVAKYDVFDIEKRKSTSIHGGNKLQYCSWSPIKNRLSYVVDNNVYIHFGPDSEIAITTEGINGVVYNGVPDWVYEEEVLSSGSAIWWSPDGSKVALGFFNDTNVKTFNYFLYGGAEKPGFQYPKEMHLKYPKPGTPNPTVALKIVDLEKKAPLVTMVKAPIDIVSADHILQNVAWADNNTVLITWLNRRQNVGSIQTCTLSGLCEEVTRLEEPKGWISMSTPKCLKEGTNCLFTYWIDNWYQVWNLNLKTGDNIWQSRGNFTVRQIYGYDEQQKKLYYQATMPGEPAVYHVFSNNDCLTCQLTDEEGALCKSAAASFSKQFSYYTVVCSGPNPSYTKIFATRFNTEIKSWETNKAFRQALLKKQLPTIEYLNVTLADGSIGLAKMYLPPNLDKSKSYPMVVNVYGGPDSVRISSAFTAGFDAFLTTKRNIIYVHIDGRGTGNKGKNLLFTVNNNLGAYEVEDQIFVTKYLQKMYPFIDRQRTGIWGWSYGGYMTARTLANDPEKVYQCGVAVAPVTSWLYYDTIYTERYMGLPIAQHTLQRYLESSVLRNVENFRNHGFLLIHGSADDNVHSQQSLMLAKILQQHDIIFEEMVYTDENHSIGNRLPHLYNTIDHFWLSCFKIDDAAAKQ